MARGPSVHAREFRARRAQRRAAIAAPIVPVDPKFNRPWFNSATAAEYLDRPSRKAFRSWAVRNNVIAVRRLYAKADIDRVLALLGRRRAS